MPLITPRAAGLVLGFALDRLIGDPRRGHPVALFGQAATRLESRTYADDDGAGTAHTAACLLPLALGGLVLERCTATRPLLRLLATAISTWAVLGARTLEAEGRLLADLLDADDITAARRRITHLCGRDPDALDHTDLARAAVESMAENASDAAVGSLFWGAVAGIPGLLVHRGANTLDAMIGHRNERYLRFGRAAARLDDALNLVPARMTALLAAALAPAVGGSPTTTLRIALRDHAKHPSPNGGWCEAAWAGALGIRLGGRNHYYGGRVEDRGILGDGSPAEAVDVRNGARLVGWVSGAALVAAVATSRFLSRGRRVRRA